MRNLYARLVLWMIRPALGVASESDKALIAELRAMRDDVAALRTEAESIRRHLDRNAFDGTLVRKEAVHA